MDKRKEGSRWGPERTLRTAGRRHPPPEVVFDTIVDPEAQPELLRRGCPDGSCGSAPDSRLPIEGRVDPPLRADRERHAHAQSRGRRCGGGWASRRSCSDSDSCGPSSGPSSPLPDIILTPPGLPGGRARVQSDARQEVPMRRVVSRRLFLGTGSALIVPALPIMPVFRPSRPPRSRRLHRAPRRERRPRRWRRVSDAGSGARARDGRRVARQPGAGEGAGRAPAGAGARGLGLGLRRLGERARRRVARRQPRHRAVPARQRRPADDLLRRDARTARRRQSVRRGHARHPADARTARHHAAGACGGRPRSGAAGAGRISNSSATRTRASNRRRSPTPKSPR